MPEAPQPAAPVAPDVPPVGPPVHVGPALPHAWNYPDLAPVPGPEPVRVERAAGTSWFVVGGGFAPGTEIELMFGRWQTDSEVFDIPTVYADANGRYSVMIRLEADFPPGTYGILVRPKPFAEETKRRAIIEVTAPREPTVH